MPLIQLFAGGVCQGANVADMCVVRPVADEINGQQPEVNGSEEPSLAEYFARAGFTEGHDPDLPGDVTVDQGDFVISSKIENLMNEPKPVAQDCSCRSVPPDGFSDRYPAGLRRKRHVYGCRVPENSGLKRLVCPAFP